MGLYLPVGQAVTSSSIKREIGSTNIEPVKSDTVWLTVCRRGNILSKLAALLPGRNDAKMIGSRKFVTGFGEIREHEGLIF